MYKYKSHSENVGKTGIHFSVLAVCIVTVLLSIRITSDPAQLSLCLSRPRGYTAAEEVNPLLTEISFSRIAFPFDFLSLLSSMPAYPIVTVPLTRPAHRQT